MAGLGLILDPTAEGTGTQLDIADGSTFAILGEPDFSPPEIETQWATSSDTEGSLPAATRHQNRTITIPTRVFGGSAGGLDTQVAKLQQKVGKILRERGTLKVTVPSGKTVVFDLLDAQISTPIRKRLLTNFIAETELRFTARPYGRGPSHAYTGHSETTLPWIVFTEVAVGGDIPALGQLTVTDDESVDHWFVMWGLRSRYYSNAATAALHYQAGALTPLGSSSAVMVGGVATIQKTDITAPWVQVMSTKIAASSLHLTHTGDFEVFALVTPTKEDVQLRLEWSTGDFQRATFNDPAAIPVGMDRSLVSLGAVTIPPAITGAQRWEGRISASYRPADGSTSTPATIVIWRLLLLPTSEGSGKATAVQTAATPQTLLAADEFDQTAGALSGKTARIGGNWTGAGDADDFSVVTGTHRAQRTAISDSNVYSGGRFARIASTNYTDVAVQVDTLRSSFFSSGSGNMLRGVYARYTDTSNFLLFGIEEPDTGASRLVLLKRVGGTNTILATAPLTFINQTLRMTVDTAGRIICWAGPIGSPLGFPVITVLGGGDVTITLATGKAGFYDGYTYSITGLQRDFDNFWVAAPTLDAAMYADQSIAIRHDGVVREDAAGQVYAPPARYEGDYLLIPPAGQEARTVELVVKPSRNDPVSMADTDEDDISAQLTVVPRYLQLPE